jgi:N-acetylglucosamine-6-phosphate deacetylase
MAFVLTNARVLTAQGFSSHLSVVIEDGRIVAVVPTRDARIAGLLTHDLDGLYLVPGFIDCQVNGGGGVLFNNAPSVETLQRIATAHLGFGTTSFLPTLISDDPSVMREAIAATRSAIAQGVAGVRGIHLEGPYLASARKGAHDATSFRVPDSAEVELATSLGNGLTLITLAPEVAPCETIRELIARGAIISGGHSEASYEEVRNALNAGMRGFTHLFNAMPALQSREPGILGAALADADSWCGIIVDGHHVHPASLRIAIAAKPRGKVFLVTDAMPPVGAATPDFQLYGEMIAVREGVCRNAVGALAGSALDMASALRNCVQMLSVPLDEAARMASTYPASFLGIDDSYGCIAAAYYADLVALDDQLTVQRVWLNGTPTDDED